MSDLELQWETDASDFSYISSIRLVIFGPAAEEGKILLLEKDSPGTWKQTWPVEL